MRKFLTFSSCIILALSIYAGGVTAEANSVSEEAETVQIEACVEDSKQVEPICIEDAIVENILEEQFLEVEIYQENCQAQENENAEEKQALEVSDCGLRCEQDEMVLFYEEDDNWHVDGELEEASVEKEEQDTTVGAEYQVISGVTEVVLTSEDADNKGEVVVVATAYAIPANEAPTTEKDSQWDIEDSNKEKFDIKYPSVAAPESTTVPVEVEDEIVVEIEDEEVPNSGVEVGEDSSEQEKENVEEPIEVEAVVIEEESVVALEEERIPNSGVSKESTQDDTVNKEVATTEVLPQTGVVSTHVFQGLGFSMIGFGMYLMMGLKRQK